MSEYQALYRKWRPMRFDEISGQDQVSVTLKNAIVNQRTSHAYLFCGTRGTGKTSTAKIFSRAINCENSQDGEPCNECATCKGILNGSILDVYEMDAASNRGVENIREIRDEVLYMPVGCKYKIYIIDEVHMLTGEAFNALLKTLEEPPPHAIFILATTEPHKIPATILSRCQRFDFRRITVSEIAKRLSEITNAEGIAITDEAVNLTAELGDGSMRDAISILDRCSAFTDGTLTHEKITEIMGIVGNDTLFEISEFVALCDTKSALVSVSKILNEGQEAQNLIENLIKHFRALLICKTSDKPADILEKTETAAEKYTEQAKKFSESLILYAIKVLSENLSQAKWLSNPEISVETAICKMCNPDYGDDKEALYARIEKLESAVARLLSGVAIKPKTPEPTKDDTPTEEPISDTKKPEPEAVSVVDAKGYGEEWDLWSEALIEIKKESKKLFAWLYNSKAYKNGSVITVVVNDGELSYEKLSSPEGITYLVNCFSVVAKEPVTVNVRKSSKKAKEVKQKKHSISDLINQKEAFEGIIDIEE